MFHLVHCRQKKQPEYDDGKDCPQDRSEHGEDDCSTCYHPEGFLSRLEIGLLLLTQRIQSFGLHTGQVFGPHLLFLLNLK